MDRLLYCLLQLSASEVGKAVSKETKIDILVTPMVTIGVGVALSAWWAPALGAAAMKVGSLIMWATELQPFLMGILVSVIVGRCTYTPDFIRAICAALQLTGLAGGAAVAAAVHRWWDLQSCHLKKTDGAEHLTGTRNLHASDGQYREKS